MPRSKPKTTDLSPAGQATLAAQLEAVTRSSPHAHQKRVGRLAVTVRACQRQCDDLPDHAVPFDACRLFALSHRWVDDQGRVTPRIVLGIYRPAIDLPGTGRVRFVCEATLPVRGRGGIASPDPHSNTTAARAALLMAQHVEDAEDAELQSHLFLPQFFFAFPPERPPVFESHVPRQQWDAAETAIGDFRAWPSELFARGPDQLWPVHPLDGSSDPWADGRATTDRDEFGGWVRRHGRSYPQAQRPAAILVAFDHLRGRPIRNPAWAVLRDHGVITPSTGYRQWLEATRPRNGGARLSADSSAARFRRDLANHVDAQPDQPARLLADLRQTCAAVGLPIPEDSDRAEDFLGSLLDDPWARPTIPDVAAIQVLRLDGPPAPSSMTFRSDSVEADLFDLGRQAARYEPLPLRRVREMFHQRRTAQITTSCQDQFHEI